MRPLERSLATISAATAGLALTDVEGRALLALAHLGPETVATVVACLQEAERHRASTAPRRRTQVTGPVARRRRMARGEAVQQRWEAYADDYATLARGEYPLDVIAARLGLSYAALDKALERHRDDPRARRPLPTG